MSDFAFLISTTLLYTANTRAPAPTPTRDRSNGASPITCSSTRTTRTASAASRPPTSRRQHRDVNRVRSTRSARRDRCEAAPTPTSSASAILGHRQPGRGCRQIPRAIAWPSSAPTATKAIARFRCEPRAPENKLAVRFSEVSARFATKVLQSPHHRYNGTIKYQPFNRHDLGSYSFYRLNGNRPNSLPPRDNISY